MLYCRAGCHKGEQRCNTNRLRWEKKQQRKDPILIGFISEDTDPFKYAHIGPDTDSKGDLYVEHNLGLYRVVQYGHSCLEIGLDLSVFNLSVPNS